MLDGEIVALDADGQPTGFQQLQGRIHLAGEPASDLVVGQQPRTSSSMPCEKAPAICATCRSCERRQVVERLFKGNRDSCCASARWCAATAARCTSARFEQGWEGLIAKHADSLYKSGKRTPDWRKLKIIHEQEFVVGGWTEPRQTRA